MIQEVTFKDFSDLARRRRWTPQSLAEKFRRRIEAPMEFLSRCLSGRYPAVVIPYRCIVDFCRREIAIEQQRSGNGKKCACGCGLPVFDRKKWALPGCKKRTARKKVTDQQKRGRQVVDFVEAKPGQNGGMATTPLPDPRSLFKRDSEAKLL